MKPNGTSRTRGYFPLALWYEHMADLGRCDVCVCVWVWVCARGKMQDECCHKKEANFQIISSFSRCNLSEYQPELSRYDDGMKIFYKSRIGLR